MGSPLDHIDRSEECEWLDYHDAEFLCDSFEHARAEEILARLHELIDSESGALPEMLALCVQVSCEVRLGTLHQTKDAWRYLKDPMAVLERLTELVEHRTTLDEA